VTSGAGYKTEDGFIEVYGDYGEVGVTNTGKTFAIWGEGYSWLGPGGLVQPPDLTWAAVASAWGAGPRIERGASGHRGR
jgi:hypothetical protein